MTKSELFKRAWEIARNAATNFGGSSKSYFSEALKQAWVESREGRNMDNETIISVKKIIQAEIKGTERKSLIAVNEEMLKILEIPEVKEEIQEETPKKAFNMLYKIFKKMTGYKPGKGFTPIN